MGMLMIAVRTSGRWLTVSTVDESTSILVAAAATSSASTWENQPTPAQVHGLCDFYSCYLSSATRNSSKSKPSLDI